MKKNIKKLQLKKRTLVRLSPDNDRQLNGGATTACITARECPPPPVTYTCFSFFCP